MWSPGLAAIATCKIMGFNLALLGWQWGQSRWHGIAFLTPVLYGLVTYLIIWVSGLGGLVDPHYLDEVGEYLGLAGWSDEAMVAFSILIFGGVAMIWRISTTLGEEIGWRGFLVPVLMRRFSFPITSLIIGLIWAFWHAPLIFYTKYNAGPYHLEWQFLNYSILMIAMSFIMTYLRLKSGSVWTAAILHAAHNAYVLSILDPMTTKYEHSWRYLGEFGFILPIITVVFALYFWCRARKEGLTGPFLE